MSTKVIRTLVATVALASMVSMAAPAEAARPSTQRNVWCC